MFDAEALDIGEKRYVVSPKLGGSGMSLDFLIGAIFGSGFAISFGRAPAYRLAAVVQRRFTRRPR
jgi:hypothetical protein